MTVHIVGGGMAGLATAVSCVVRGLPVAIYEAAPRFGGRCATFLDHDLGVEIDNGTHVVVSANTSTMRYLAMTGGLASLIPARTGRISMRDLRTGYSFSATSRLSWRDGVAMLRLALSEPGAPALRSLSPSRAVAAFWEPMCTATLNTPLREADARLLWRTVRRMFVRTREGPVPLLAATSLAATYVDPAAAWLKLQGAALHTTVMITEGEGDAGRVTRLIARDRAVDIGDDDAVVIAVPFWSPLLEGIGINPSRFVSSPIVNVTFRLAGAPANDIGLTGLIGGTSHWLMVRQRTATVTVSAAEDLIDRSAEEIAADIWREVAPVLDLSQADQPPFRVIKERRATLRHTAAMQRLRPGPKTRWQNVTLAGDWVPKSLPCTIESAIASGFAAAAALSGKRNQR